MPGPLAFSALLLAMPAAASPPAGASEPILAVEDSLRVYSLPETTYVRAKRVPLLDLIRKAQEGERRKYDGIDTMAYNQTVKVTVEFAKRNEHTESIRRVYYRDRDQWATAPIREVEYTIDADGTRRTKNEDKKGGVKVSVEADDDISESLSKIPFYLERVDKFDYRIADRHLWPDQVLYEIAFQPKSDFEMLPSGRLWILTRGYQIVREEFHFRHLPLPGILKSVDLVTREWQEEDGHWVPKRVSGRADFRLPGFFDVPKSIELVVVYDDYRFNLPLDEALFSEKKP